jgi:hypothetical protein
MVLGKPETIDVSRMTLGSMVFIDDQCYINNGNQLQCLHDRDLAHCLQTYTGKFFWPLQPRADELCIEDIAHGIACEYRYGNHSPYPYSVAWHSVALSYLVPEHLRQFALVHDAPEAYIKDIPRTIRRQEPFKSMYQEIDDRLMGVCCEFFGIEDQMEEFYDYDILMSYSEMVVWAESNISYLAKLTAMNVNLEPARDPAWLEWVRDAPKHEHWQRSEARWRQRYDELF